MSDQAHAYGRTMADQLREELPDGAQLGMTVDGALHVLEHQEPACPV